MYKYTCKKCGNGADTIKDARKIFGRSIINNKDVINDVCKNCKSEELKQEEWKDGKLKCRLCGEFKTIDNFTKSKSYSIARDFHDFRCNNCKTKQNHIRRASYSDDRKIENILISRFHGAKDRSIKKQIPFDLTLDFLKELLQKQNNKCAISGIEMTFILDNGRNPFNISIDQIDPNKGYTKDNIQLVCMAVNQLKSDFDTQTILKICSGIIQKYKED